MSSPTENQPQTDQAHPQGCPRHQSSSIVREAACVMVGARVHERLKQNRRKLGSHAMHWGVLFVAIVLSIPVMLPTLSEPARDWLYSNLLDSPGNWRQIAVSVLAASVFSFGFIHRLGAERVINSCAMLRRLGPATILGVIWSAIPSFAGVMLLLNMEPIRFMLVGDSSSQLYIFGGMLIYLFAFIVLAGLGCLPTISQAILAGYTFGLPAGFALAILGFGGASLVGHEVVGRLVRWRVENEIQRCPKTIFIRDTLLHASTSRSLLIVALLRASPSTPFALTNLLLSSVGISRGVFFFGTLIGMIPRTFAAVLIGHQITTWTGSFDKPAWVLVVGIAALIILVVLVSKASATALARVAHTQDTSPIFARQTIKA